ncbi:hypothetical protein Pla123a_21650 [Posidoniimonas polymericola]|uniref:PIN domain-containing protein n=2 Tax=Posidoniimonas polymericola TaxID=2528002 RepID=A0A5C5YRC4_9BACT|nr:hypothetical protein Pla123a_21650 [Posidoniimonas polymericola]
MMDRRDQWHEAANKAWALLVAGPGRYVTTPQVMWECGNAMARTGHGEVVANLFQEMSEHGNLIDPSPSEVVAAWSAYRNAPAGGPSIVDCLSFEVMRRVGATESFTNDRHFAAAGFATLF